MFDAERMIRCFVYIQLKKDQLHRIRNDCQVCLAEKAKSKPDEVFRNALSSFSKVTIDMR